MCQVVFLPLIRPQRGYKDIGLSSKEFPDNNNPLLELKPCTYTHTHTDICINCLTHFTLSPRQDIHIKLLHKFMRRDWPATLFGPPATQLCKQPYVAPAKCIHMNILRTFSNDKGHTDLICKAMVTWMEKKCCKTSPNVTSQFNLYCSASASRLCPRCFSAHSYMIGWFDNPMCS